MKGYESFTKEKMVYLYKATKPITYKKLQNRIYFELSNHIDDMFCDYIDNGMNEENATEKFLNEMGNPEELGQELKKAHSKMLFLIKLRNVAIILTVFVLIISVFGYNESLDNLKLAKQYELPEETVVLEKSLSSYMVFEYHFSYLFSNINWYNWNTNEPLYKVKENNLFKDYYVLDESQSIVVDLSRAMYGLGSGTIYVDDITKIPNNYNSNKLSKVVFSHYFGEECLEITPELTTDEVTEIEILATQDYDEYIYGIELTSNENGFSYWGMDFYIKDLEGLSYSARWSLSVSTDGNYYIVSGSGGILAEIPEHISVKIDKAFEEAGISFD